MNIKLTCKLSDSDAWYFLEPIIKSEKIEKLILYRNSKLSIIKTQLGNKIIGKYQSGCFRFLFRLFAMIIDSPSANVFVGIYEIPHGLLALIAAKFHQKPVIINIIGNPKYEFRNKGLRGWLTNWIYRQANVVTVTGNESKNYLITQKKVKKDKIFILPNSIPLNIYNNKNIKKSYDLVTLGRLSPEKGLFNLLNIISILRKRLPNIKLGIAGKGSMYNDLKVRIQHMQLKQNVDLLGYVNDAVAFLNSSKLFITTSFTEGLPRSTIQSMACGTPVIASEVGDMADLVINGKTGVLISDANDLDAFVEGIFQLLVDEERLNDFTRNGMNHATKYYGHSAAKEIWEDIFKYLKIIE
jgi:glycosyltransferase involved in cell wall biosynthesis